MPGDVGHRAGARSDVAREPFEVQPILLRDVGAPERREQDDVGCGKRCRIHVLMQRPARRRASRLEHRPQAPARVAAAQRFECGKDGRRVMSEIVVDEDAVRRAHELLPAPNAFERRERRARVPHGNAEALGASRHRRDRVAHVVQAGHAKGEAPAAHASDVQIERLLLRSASAGAGAPSHVGVTSPVSSPSRP